MFYINKITTDPQPSVILTGITGLTINVTLRFMPRVQRWIMGLEFGANNTSIQGIAITTAPNMLRQYRNQITFGIACISAAGTDPFTINDFATQASNLYLLDSADVAQIESDFYQ
jgi:hypothetical protein